METLDKNCPMCNSQNFRKFNSYKHQCFACGDCNGIFHLKKERRYLLEYIFPRFLAKRFFPEKAFLRLFHASKDYRPSSFYEVYGLECAAPNAIRKSEVHELHDNFDLANVKLEGKNVLDISGGPGLVVKSLTGITNRAIVTEYCEEAAVAMAEVLGVETRKFCYNSDRLEDVFDEKFNIVLLRSSIIFCEDLEKLVCSIDRVLDDDGYVLIETIIPSLGEVFWWQQMEFKFPMIYSQEFIEKTFYKFGYSLTVAHREYGSYVENKWRRRSSLLRMLFTWLVDFPMMLAYYFVAPKGKIPIDQKSHHKMLTQIWRKRRFCPGDPIVRCVNTEVGASVQSTHFTQVYNGWLTRLKGKF